MIKRKGKKEYSKGWVCVDEIRWKCEKWMI